MLVAPDAHIAWFAQPSQAVDLPASSDSVPYEEYQTSDLAEYKEMLLPDSVQEHFPELILG
jgi:hypothetical protein